jgi:hypothetical protein
MIVKKYKTYVIFHSKLSAMIWSQTSCELHGVPRNQPQLTQPLTACSSITSTELWLITHTHTHRHSRTHRPCAHSHHSQLAPKPVQSCYSCSSNRLWRHLNYYLGIFLEGLRRWPVIESGQPKLEPKTTAVPSEVFPTLKRHPISLLQFWATLCLAFCSILL